MFAQILNAISALGAILGLFKKTPVEKENDANKEIDDETNEENKTGRPDSKFFGDRGL